MATKTPTCLTNNRCSWTASWHVKALSIASSRSPVEATAYRARNRPSSGRPIGRRSTFYGSNWCEMKLSSITIALLSLAAVGIAWSQDERPATKASTPEALRSEIEALQAAKVAWREIAWKSCLLEGLKEARAKNKPALLWVFIDRPIDDARC